MKKLVLFIFAVLFLGSGVYAGSCDNWQTLHPDWILCEDWDSGTPHPDWPCNATGPGGHCTSDLNAFNSWTAAQYSDICTVNTNVHASGISTTRAHSGTRSYYQRRAAGYNWVCDIIHTLPTNPTKIHIRFYVYFEYGWANFNGPPPNDPEEWVHFVFTNSAYSC